MKLFLFATLTLRAVAHLQLAGPWELGGRLREHFSFQAETPPTSEGVHYGDSRCPCIGFDNIAGETLLQVEGEGGQVVQMTYPADVGAHCEAWDDRRHVQCKRGSAPGAGKGWCAQSWCYVDPCNCDIDVLPKLAVYNSEATYRGQPLFWSYATCGAKDMFTRVNPELGNSKCRCIGFSGMSGTMEVSFDGQMVEYPATLGASCQAWDLNVHPDCKGDKPPAWCKATWCYVDPCGCDLPGDVSPKISSYLPEATFTGKSLYYSYETCGSADTWTEENHQHACVNQDDKESCKALARCEWTGEKCMGWELVDHMLCKKKEKEHGNDPEAGQDSGSPTLKHSVLSAAAIAAAMALAYV